MVVNLSRRSRKYGKQCKRSTLTEISSTETSIITRSCHLSLGGQGYSSGWTRRTIIWMRRETQSCTARSLAMQTKGVSTLASTHSQDSKIFLNKSGVSCLIRYHRLILGSKRMTTDASTAQTKTIWLKFFGATLHGNRSLARIALRDSLGEEPTEAQIVTKCKTIKSRNVRRALAEKMRGDICRAFNRGEEV